jgi:hypothetical protein
MTTTDMFRCAGSLALVLTTFASAGCDTAEGEGTLRVSIYGESFIEDEIPADVFVDGWRVELTRFLVAVDDVDADGEPVAGQHVFDLSQSSGGDGHDLATLAIPAGTVETLSYRIAPTGADAVLGNATEADLATMRDGGWSIFVEGSASKGADTKTFAWGFTTTTRYSPCETNQALTDGGMATSQITIHADHLFYDDLDSEEPNVAFDLVAAADADTDGVVTTDELAAIDITGEDRYQVGSRDIADLQGFIAAQTSTLGHIDGEGHCETET